MWRIQIEFAIGWYPQTTLKYVQFKPTWIIRTTRVSSEEKLLAVPVKVNTSSELLPLEVEKCAAFGVNLSCEKTIPTWPDNGNIQQISIKRLSNINSSPSPSVAVIRFSRTTWIRQVPSPEQELRSRLPSPKSLLNCGACTLKMSIAIEVSCKRWVWQSSAEGLQAWIFVWGEAIRIALR